MGWMVVAPISKWGSAGACAGSTAMMGMIAGASTGSTAWMMFIMAGGAMGGTIGMRWLMIGVAIGGSTIAAVVTGVTVNSNKVVKQHAGDEE